MQRFLSLTDYFWKFIKDYALQARPLQNLLKKSIEFVFDDACNEVFNKLKRELTAYSVLRLYNPVAETELHTDACSFDLGASVL